MNTSYLGNSIRRNRKMLDLTQEQLAELLDVSSHYVYELEQGTKLPSLATLVTMAEIFHVGIDSLLSPRDDTSVAGDELENLLKGLTPNERTGLCRVLKGLMPNLRL